MKMLLFEKYSIFMLAGDAAGRSADLLSSNSHMKLFLAAVLVIAAVIAALISVLLFSRSKEKQREKQQRQALEEQMIIMRSLSNIYLSAFYVDIKRNTYTGINGSSSIRDIVVMQNGADSVLEAAVTQLSDEEHRESMLKFIDFATLPERMGNEKIITLEFRGDFAGWCRANFIVAGKDALGGLSHVIFAVQEIDEEKKKELDYQNKLAESAEEATRANLAKSEFLSRMSHDIRTPMNGIMGMLDIVKKNRHDEARVDDGLKKIETSAGYLLTLINDVLEMNRIESGKLYLTEEPFDLNEILANDIRITRQLAIEYGVTVYGDVPKELPHPYLLGSPLYIRQLLMNIEGNAVKYNKPGGTVDCSVEEISSTEDTATFRFRIADTGIGMSEAFMEHIFEPFSQEKSDSRTTFSGSGLGMAIVKKLADAMHGTVEVESTVGVGSVFTVTLTFGIDKCPSQKKQGELQMDANTLSGARILLVEDNEINMEIAQFMLEEAGARIETAENGQIAVDKFEEAEAGYYDIILMDIMMPVMDGLTASKRIRASGKTDAKTITIIAMTANAFAEDVKKCLDAGMNAHIAKPLNVDNIVNTVCPFIKTAAGPHIRKSIKMERQNESRPSPVMGYGLNEWEKKTNLMEYNHALFMSMKEFTDTCWEINVEKATVVIMQELLHPEFTGRQFGYQQIVAEFFDNNVCYEERSRWLEVMDLYWLRTLREEYRYEIGMKNREGKRLNFQVMLYPSFDAYGKTNIVYLSAKNQN